MTTPRPADIRAWARENGHDVAGSGRIPAAVRQAYDTAHAPAAEPVSARPAVPTSPAPAPAPAPPTPVLERGPYAGPVEYRTPPWASSPPPQQQGADGLAITALILGFFGVLGLVFGVIALFRIRRSGRPGRKRAIAGIVLGILWIVGIVIAAVTADTAERASDGSVEAAGSVTADDIRVGDCPKSLLEGDQLTVDLVPCAEPHEAEAVASFRLDGVDFPGQDEVFRFAEGGCSKRIADLLPEPAPDYGLFYLAPTAQTWREGDREVICLVTAQVEGEQLVGRVPRA